MHGEVGEIMKKTLVVLAAGLFLSSALIGMNLTQNVKAENFGTDLQISSNWGKDPDIEVDNSGNIFVVWQDGRVWLSKSSDGGQSFSTSLEIGDGFTPSISVDDNDDVHIVWEDEGQIFYSESNDGGNTFSSSIIVSDGQAGDLDEWSGNPEIATYEDNIYIVWRLSNQDNLSFDKNIEGSGFGTDIKVNDVDERPSGPSIAIGSDETIYIAWQNALGFYNFDVRVAKSTDQGNSFEDSVIVGDSNSMLNPSIAAYGSDKVYVSYLDMNEEFSCIRFARSTDKAETFEPSVNVSHSKGTIETGGYINDIRVHPCGKIFVTWYDKTSGEKEIYFANSTNEGESFGENFNINDGSEKSEAPAMAVGSDTQPYIVWFSDKNEGRIFFDKAPDATRPSKVSDLSTNGKTTDSIMLQWTATGDNFDLGTVSSYTVKYSTEPITAENWDEATLFSGSVDIDSAGNTENLNLTGLEENILYYFALKASDEVPNTSPISNVENKKTLSDTTQEAEEDTNGSPGFELLVVFLAMIIISILAIKRKKL